MKSHHAQAHGTSIAGYNYTCHWCGESGRKRQIDDRDDHQFCSTGCYHEWRKETLVGENSPVWEGKTVTVNCDWCGGETEKAQCRLQKNQRAFCSQDCHGQWLSENNTGRSNPQWEGRLNDVDCDQCGTTFKRDPSKLERNTHNFCCKQCYSEWMSDHRTGENHPRWKEGRRLSYGPNWHKNAKSGWRKMVKCASCVDSTTTSMWNCMAANFMFTIFNH